MALSCCQSCTTSVGWLEYPPFPPPPTPFLPLLLLCVPRSTLFGLKDTYWQCRDTQLQLTPARLHSLPKLAIVPQETAGSTGSAVTMQSWLLHTKQLCCCTGSAVTMQSIHMEGSQTGLGSVHMQGSQSVVDSKRSGSLNRQESGGSVQSPFQLSKGTAAGESTMCHEPYFKYYVTVPLSARLTQDAQFHAGSESHSHSHIHSLSLTHSTHSLHSLHSLTPFTHSTLLLSL